MSSSGDHRQKSSMAGCSPMRSWAGWRRVSMAFERQQSAAASLTLSWPGLSAPGLSDATGQYRLLSGLRLASEPIRNRTCHRGTEPDTTHIQKQPPSTPYWASKGAARGQGQRPGWPLISRHVWTRTRTKRGPRQLIIICGVMKEGKRAPDCCMQLFQCGFSVYFVGMATWSVTVGPPDLPQNPPPLPQMYSSCPRSLCWGPGGRNYTRDDPILLGLPAFQVGLTFVGWLWSYPPPSVATTELIPLMSSYADHHVATIHSLSLQKLEALCWI